MPKTIDNDVGDSEFKLIDHTPGYGSTARYWAHAVQFANEENAGSSPADPVLVLQAMGRKIGFIPAAARLADPGRELPLQIYLAERPVTLEQIADNVSGLLRRAGRAILVVSEGLSIGDLGARKDAFGHTQFGASELTVAQSLINELNAKGLPVKGSARANVPGTDQRHNMIYASTVDLDEAYRTAKKRPSWRQRGPGASWPPSCVSRGRFITSVTTRCRSRKWPIANAHSRPSGSALTAPTSATISSVTPVP